MDTNALVKAPGNTAMIEGGFRPVALKTADDLTKQAHCYVALQQYVKAEELYWQALEVRKNVLGTSHLEVASTLQDLAELYEAQSQHKKANRLYEWALEITEHVLGRQHAVVSQSLKNLLHFYRNFGQCADSTDIEALPEFT